MAGRRFMNGNVVYPQSETMARLHNIRNITPGAIATCGVLVCYSIALQVVLIFMHF